MKKLLFILVSLTIIVTLSLLSVEGYAGSLEWRKYDNFNSGVIDPDRWDIDSSSADISIVDGRAKFEHRAGVQFADDSSWLEIKKGRRRIQGIRATVTVESCMGDVRGRIAVFSGKVGDDYIWDQLGLQGGLDRIFGSRVILEAGTFDVVYRPFRGRFEEPLAILGNTFIITMVFSQKKVTYAVNGLGKFTYKIPGKVSKTDNYQKGIGTYSENGDGPCVVYFDDVYVLK